MTCCGAFVMYFDAFVVYLWHICGIFVAYLCHILTHRNARSKLSVLSSVLHVFAVACYFMVYMPTFCYASSLSSLS